MPRRTSGSSTFPSRAFDVSDAQRAAIFASRYDDAVFSDAEQALLLFVRAVANSPTVDDASFSRFRAHFSDRITVEVIVLVGYYFTIARLATGLDLEIDIPEDDALIRLAGSR